MKSRLPTYEWKKKLTENNCPQKIYLLCIINAASFTEGTSQNKSNIYWASEPRGLVIVYTDRMSVWTSDFLSCRFAFQLWLYLNIIICPQVIVLEITPQQQYKISNCDGNTYQEYCFYCFITPTGTFLLLNLIGKCSFFQTMQTHQGKSVLGLIKNNRWHMRVSAYMTVSRAHFLGYSNAIWKVIFVLNE